MTTRAVGTAHPERPFLLSLALSLLLFSGSVFASDEGQTSLIGFQIADQFDRVHRDTEVRGDVLLVVGADKEGSRHQGQWVAALQAVAADHAAREPVRIIEVADLRGVPFFVKGRVKGSFPSDRRQWVLMDWKGVFARTYLFEADKCNILVFDRAGKLVHQVAVRDLDAAVLDQVRGRIEVPAAESDQVEAKTGSEGSTKAPK